VGIRAGVVFYAFLAAVLLVAAFFSRSRMGILSIVFSLIFMGLWGQIKTRGRGARQVTLFILGITAAYAIWIGAGPVLERYEAFKQADFLEREGRLLVWKAESEQIRDFPILGTGLGTFGLAYRRYQRAFTDYFVDHAHNDYLEFTSELGLVGALLLFLPIFYLFIKMLYVFVGEPSRYRRSVLLGCAGSIFAMLIHTAADFNLQIPANALVFALILGIGYKVVCVEPRRRSVTAEGCVVAGE
jgi:O-antigen ligase